MCVQVDGYRPDFRARWERFVKAANNGTVFHRQRFLDYHPADRFRSQHLIFRRENKILALLPGVIKEVKGAKHFISHAGASYGGFVVSPRLGVHESHLVVGAFIDFLRKGHFRRVELTPPPVCYNAQLTNYIDFALLKHGFEYVKRELTSVVSLPPLKEDVFTSFKSEARTATRRAQKLGVVIRESDDYEDFYNILRQNLRMRHNVAPTHTLEEILHLKSLLPEEIRLFSAYFGDQQIAGVVLFACNPSVILAFYISHRQEFQKYRSLNLLFYQVIDWGRQHGFKFLDFGTFTLNMEPNWGLGKFKETFGAKGIFRDTLYLDLSP